MATAASVLALAIPARAQDEPARAEALRDLRDGNQRFERADYAGALEAYQRAYARVPSPKLLFNLGQTYRNLGRPVEAIEAYERFRVEARDAAAPELLREAEQHVAELERAVGALDVTATLLPGGQSATGAAVIVDGVARATIPPPRPIRVAPGPHVVIVKLGAAWAQVAVTARAGERAVLAAQLAPAPAGLQSTTTAVLAAPSPPAPARAPISRLGLILRADVDRALAGVAPAAALSIAAGPRLDLAVGGFFWPAGGKHLWGASLGAIVHLSPGALRPLLAAEGEVYADRGLHAGARATAGLEWQLAARLGVFATVSIAHVTASFRESTFVVPAAGIHARL